MSRDSVSTSPDGADINLPGLPFFTGGIIPRPAQILIYAGRGAGKSTIAAQLAEAAQKDGKRVGFILTETSVEDHLAMLQSLGIPADRFGLWEVSDPTALVPHPDLDLLIVDSINGLGQVRSQIVYGRILSFVRLCRRRKAATVLISHATKAGTAAGPSSFQHAVDAVLRLTRAGGNHILHTEKRRRIGKWATQRLVKEVPLILGPTGFKYSPHAEPTVATAMGYVGGRLTPVQALVCLPPGRLHCPGFQRARVKQLLPTLQEYAGILVDLEQIGLSLLADRYDRSLDLAIAVAINASYMHEDVPTDCMFIGTLGLNGVILPLAEDAAAIGVALSEAPTAGRLFVSSASRGLIEEMVSGSAEVIGVSCISECLARLRGM